LITAGDNPQRLNSESGFAALCGVSPDIRKSLPSPFRRIKIINDEFVYSYESKGNKVYIDKINMTVHFVSQDMQVSEKTTLKLFP